MKQKSFFRNALFGEYGVRWPFQIAVYIGIFKIIPGILEILIAGDLVNLIVNKYSAFEEINSYRETLYNAADTLMNIITILALILFFRLMNQKKSISNIGLTKDLRSSVLKNSVGLLIGIVSMSVIVTIQIALGYVHTSKFVLNSVSIGTFIMLVSAAALEEIFVRGALQYTLQKHINAAASILIPSVIFGLIHIGNKGISILSMINIILAGLFLALLTYRTKSIYAAIGFHTTWNFFEGIVFGQPVSGNDISQFPFMNAQIADKARWLSGKEFGPEETIWSTMVFIIMILAIEFYYFKKNNKKRIENS
jgi:membrane protease YdiL (CAAX protease family)